MIKREILGFFSELIESDYANQKCFDCGNPSPDWASLNNSIFICQSCAQCHQGLGAQISLVRDIRRLNLNDSQYRMMFAGGNGRLRAYFDQF